MSIARTTASTLHPATTKPCGACAVPDKATIRQAIRNRYRMTLRRTLKEAMCFPTHPTGMVPHCMSHVLEAMIGPFAYVTADGHVGSRPRMLSGGQMTNLVGGPRKKQGRMPDARKVQDRCNAGVHHLLVLPSLPHAKPFEMPLELGGVPLQPMDCIFGQTNGK